MVLTLPPSNLQEARWRSTLLSVTPHSISVVQGPAAPASPGSELGMHIQARPRPHGGDWQAMF